MLPLSPPDDVWDQPELDFMAAAQAQIMTYEQGEMSVQAWIDWLRQTLWRYAWNVADREFGGPTALGRLLAREWYNANLNYLNRWGIQLAQNPPASLQPLLWRVQLYADAGRWLQQRAMVRALGMPDLPFYPAQFTLCRMRCKCQWSIISVPGGYDCYWILGRAEHCSTCLARSRAAYPLRIRGGLIEDIQRYQSAELYA